jgi:hypothetical protein
MRDGTIRGNTVELDESPGLPGGQSLTVILRPVLASREGLKLAACAWQDAGEEFGEWEDMMRHSRDLDRLIDG